MIDLAFYALGFGGLLLGLKGCLNSFQRMGQGDDSRPLTSRAAFHPFHASNDKAKEGINHVG